MVSLAKKPLRCSVEAIQLVRPLAHRPEAAQGSSMFCSASGFYDP